MVPVLPLVGEEGEGAARAIVVDEKIDKGARAPHRKTAQESGDHAPCLPLVLSEFGEKVQQHLDPDQRQQKDAQRTGEGREGR